MNKFNLATEPGVLVRDPKTSPPSKLGLVWEPDKIIAALAYLGIHDIIYSDEQPSSSLGLWYQRDQVSPRGTAAPGRLLVNANDGLGWVACNEAALLRYMRRKGGFARDVSAMDFGAVANGSDQTAFVQKALNSLPSTGGTVIIENGVKFNLRNLVFPARSNMEYRVDDDLSIPGPEGDIGSGERVHFSANSSYPADPTGGIVNEWRHTAAFHPAVITDVRKDVAGHAYEGVGQSRTAVARNSWIMADEQYTSAWVQYVMTLARDLYNALNITTVRREVILNGIGTAAYAPVPAVGDIITGVTSKAKGYVLNVSAARTTLMWLTGRFVAGEAVTYGTQTTTAVISSASFVGTPHQNLSQSLETGNWVVGLPPGATRELFAVGGKIAATRTRTMGQHVEHTVVDPAFVLVDNPEAASPQGFEATYDTTTLRLVARKYNTTANVAHIGAATLHTVIDNAVVVDAGSFNVASVVKLGTGRYRITPIAPFSTARYAVSATASVPQEYPIVTNKTAGFFEIQVFTTGTTTPVDATSPIDVMVMGGDK